MSYARWGCDGSDVYIYGIDGGRIVCSCSEGPNDGPFVAKTYDEIVSHLHGHQKSGWCVPEFVFTKLREDLL